MAHTQPDMTVADAIDRVLEVEQEAADAIRAAEAEAEALLRTARETRRQILDRARDRATRLHVRAQARLADTLAQLDSQARSAEGAGAPLAALAERAIEQLALRLAADDHESP
jgi:vacuolar-type H+-ATPase subunit H